MAFWHLLNVKYRSMSSLQRGNTDLNRVDSIILDKQIENHYLPFISLSVLIETDTLWVKWMNRSTWNTILIFILVWCSFMKKCDHFSGLLHFARVLITMDTGRIFPGPILGSDFLTLHGLGLTILKTAQWQ